MNFFERNLTSLLVLIIISLSSCDYRVEFSGYVSNQSNDSITVILNSDSATVNDTILILPNTTERLVNYFVRGNIPTPSHCLMGWHIDTAYLNENKTLTKDITSDDNWEILNFEENKIQECITKINNDDIQ